MTDQPLLESLDNGVLTLTLNRPERRNTFTPEMTFGLAAALNRAAANRDVGAIVLRGAGGHFSAGGDVGSMAAGRPGGYEERVTNLRQRMETARILHEISKPTIALIQGACAGAGLCLALACDMRFAAESIRLSTAFARVGLSGDFGGTYFLTRLVGPARARELYWLPRVLSGVEAYQAGLLNAVFPDDKVEAESFAVARTLAAGPRLTLAHMKANFNLAETGTLAEVLDAEALRHIRCQMTEDHREAARAFVEKRAPVFKGE
jgi:2-(1,2-epoxy-1,2-dihydrophenyl)acetyl-CoA isomerase